MPRTSRTTTSLLALTLALTACSTPPPTAAPHDDTHLPTTDQALLPTAEQALKRLEDGNRRFVESRPSHDHTTSQWRRRLVEGQHPFAVIVGCADSRAPVELIFDQGLGDLFVIRNAGNIMTTDVLGSIEYAAEHLHTPLVVVMGHEQCGAVTAALSSEQTRAMEDVEIRMILSLIDPALQAYNVRGTTPDAIHAGVEANVRYSVAHLRDLAARSSFPEIRNTVVVGAVYELDSGYVRIIDSPLNR